MLWLQIKLTERVFINNVVLTLLAKEPADITVDIDGEQHKVPYNGSKKFPTFTLHARDFGKGLRLGFKASPNIHIRREKYETQLPTK